MNNYFDDLSKNSQSFDNPTAKHTHLLNRQLADTVDLRLQARQARFNVRGPYAPVLQPLFDGLARDLRHFADLIAQRITVFGGTASASVRFAASESNLRDYPLDALEAQDHLKALLSGYSRYELDTRRNLDTAEAEGDLETVKLLCAILVSIEKSLWFLEAYLEGIAVGLHGRKLPAWFSTFGDTGEAGVATTI
jgi:starvation-inducible DNA-binding protein